MKPVLLFLLYLDFISQLFQCNVAGEHSSHGFTTEKDASISTDQPQWLETLREQIARAVRERGYDAARPHIRQAVEDIENSTNLRLHVKVGEDGTATVQYGTVFRASKHKKKAKSKMLREEALWMKEFQNFVKSIVQIFGKEKVKQMIEPTIKAIEQRYSVIITDVDIDQFGNVLVAYDMLKNVIAEFK